MLLRAVAVARDYRQTATVGGGDGEGDEIERQRSDLRRATDIVLVEDGAVIYWPRTGEQFADAAYAMARVQATLA